MLLGQGDRGYSSQVHQYRQRQIFQHTFCHAIFEQADQGLDLIGVIGILVFDIVLAALLLAGLGAAW